MRKLLCALLVLLLLISLIACTQNIPGADGEDLTQELAYPVDTTPTPNLNNEAITFENVTTLTNEDGTGIIYFGMALEDVIAKFDELGIEHSGLVVKDDPTNFLHNTITITTGFDDFGLPEEQQDFRNARYFFRENADGVLVLAGLAGDLVLTPKGLRVGDTYEQMIELYGDGYVVVEYDNPPFYSLVYHFDDAILVIQRQEWYIDDYGNTAFYITDIMSTWKGAPGRAGTVDRLLDNIFYEDHQGAQDDDDQGEDSQDKDDDQGGSNHGHRPGRPGGSNQGENDDEQ
ncbi:MAG: hypothetical protein FWE06_03360 [Oscillospiraceae bacterium]|nr:hypothetical protein [Oscillospiraceae bacterium]